MAATCKKSDFLHVLAATILFFLLSACSPVLYETVTFTDESDNTTVTRSTGNVLAGYPISKRVSLNAECRYVQQPVEGHPSETAVYEAPFEILQKLIEAQEVIVRIRGSGQTVERKFETENYQFMRRFLEKVRR